MKNTLRTPNTLRNTLTTAAAAGLCMKLATGCAAASTGKDLLGNPTPAPKNPYSAAEQEILRPEVGTILTKMEALSAYKQASPSTVPGTGNAAYCDTSFSVGATDKTKNGNGLSGSMSFDIDTPVGDNNDCPKPTAENVERLAGEVDLADGTKYRLNLDKDFTGIGDPTGVEFTDRSGVVPESKAPDALQGLSSAVTAAATQEPVISQQLLSSFQAATTPLS